MSATAPTSPPANATAVSTITAGSPGKPSADAAAKTAFFAAIKSHDAAQVEALLSAHPALANAQNPSGISAVLAALFILEKQAFWRPQTNPILASVLARHPVLDPFEAAAVGDYARVAAEIARDPAFIRSAARGWSALHFASFGGQREVAELLIDKGADINFRSKNKFENTPLQVALLTAQAQTEVAQLLILRGADVNVVQAEGLTALHEAVIFNSKQLIAILLDAGANVNAAGPKGETPLDMAVRGDKKNAAAILRERGGHVGTKEGSRP
jgi:ankyrin repeat protein